MLSSIGHKKHYDLKMESKTYAKHNTKVRYFLKVHIIKKLLTQKIYLLAAALKNRAVLETINSCRLKICTTCRLYFFRYVLILKNGLVTKRKNRFSLLNKPFIVILQRRILHIYTVLYTGTKV